MRFLKYLILFWLISIPAFYLWGMPYLAQFVERKTKFDTFNGCMAQMAKQNTPQLTTQDHDSYCRCLTEGIMVTTDDMVAMATTRAIPKRMQDSMIAQATSCGNELRNTVEARQPARQLHPTPTPAAQPDRVLEDGSVEIHL